MPAPAAEGPLLRRRGVVAIRALLELALDPPRWRSVSDLARSQELPAPMLEQVLLCLRRGGLVAARRGRQGGYRLAAPPAALSLALILTAVRAAPAGGPEGQPETAATADPAPWPGNASAGDLVTAALERRLRRALERELERLTLEDLLHDLRSARAALSEEGGLLLG